MGVSTSEGNGKCLEDNAGISEGMYYLKLSIKVLETDMDAIVLFLIREIVMYFKKKRFSKTFSYKKLRKNDILLAS